MSSPDTNPIVKHNFVIVVPVADRPRQLADCLDSLLELRRTFGAGEGRIRVLIADDSADPASVAAHRALASHYSRLGIPVAHFGPDEQFDLAASAGSSLSRIVGQPSRLGHKGQGVARNLAYLKLAREGLTDDTLVWSIDSDQEFRVKVATPEGDREPFAVDYFRRLDEIFTQTDALVLTGKVVGDPPVSPAVMAGNFLDDVAGFIRQMGDGPCRHHGGEAHGAGEPAYHDMADLFGFKPAAEPFRYRCPLPGDHTEADCLDHFAERLSGFFYGEHPTRVSYHQGDDDAPKPARTVYAGNYVFRPDALKYFIPFSTLRLRMSGPTLGRIVRAEIGDRFVSANLPMLHRRTARDMNRSEFRPGVAESDAAIDISDEFERQFHGDVMLFSVERGALSRPETIDDVRAEMLARYNDRRAALTEKLARLDALIGSRGWPPATLARLGAFRDNIERNFGPASPALARINAEEHWRRWRAGLLDALRHYPGDRRAWDSTTCSPTSA
ncbi:MAG: hypothetical protein OHM77_04390 [Candidatus Nitricoxidivorans perseverans]|uniref:Glycosyltransferase n=1 Tax=Candidatus Nitricoxidivorans perseverans TaxID=2975601 RepID=A0AA49J189_9PROT|nr:MAG: hypothetical protein OHM77_04390 [Candidatus Nitricoxidivorans perseverans]